MELARLGLGNVSPNPMVGCVIVHDDKIIGEGFHQQYGGPHAEVNAINSVKDKTNPDCGYVRYENWDLTKSSSVFNFERIKKPGSCPFRFSLRAIQAKA